MTTEQNESLPAPSAQSAPQESNASPENSENGSQAGSQAGQPQGHRRRRRKRKGGKPPAIAQAVGQPAPPAQPGQSAPPGDQAAPPRQPRPQQPRQKAKSPAGQGRSFQENRSQKNQGQKNPGNGQGGGGQQRRKGGKPRRQQTFVGPMDHSYRAANGNMADGPPSTIEYHNGSGQYHQGFHAEPEPPELPPAVLREDAPVRIFCFIEDLFFLAKIQETARKLGVKVSFVKADKDIVTRLAGTPEDARPSLIVFDLNNLNAKPLTLIPKLKAKLKRGTSVIGFLSHLQGDLKAKAVEAGCDMVMPRSAFSQNLPNLLRRHGLEEELEVVEA